MTKTFTEKGIEYLLVEVPEDAFGFDVYEWFYQSIYQLWCSRAGFPDSRRFLAEYIPHNHAIISLLKDITEEQAKEITGEVDYLTPLATYKGHLLDILENDVDTSLNWLLLKRI